MNELRECSDHGYFADEACPDCGADGTLLLTPGNRRQLSKFTSGVLRHFPTELDLDMDKHGWVSEEALLEGVADRYDWAEPDHFEGVIATDPNGRFEREDGRIRAAYGHSFDVTIESDDDGSVPDVLYHGTAPENLESIREVGLQPMSRQWVHLSETREDARRVGERHADDPVVLEIDADGLQEDFDVDKRGERTYTVLHVPTRFIEFPDEDE